MEATLNGHLVASARQLHGDTVIYSEEGQPSMKLLVHEVMWKLAERGASTENIEKFVNDLRIHRVATIEEEIFSLKA
jgi:hypothetical protein